MTQREFYNAVIATVDNDELKAFATEAIAKLDERNAKRASKESKTQIANKPIANARIEDCGTLRDFNAESIGTR